LDFVLFAAGQIDRERRPLLLQDLSITHYSIANRSRDLFAVIAKELQPGEGHDHQQQADSGKKWPRSSPASGDSPEHSQES
jgi:hypothetical protein